MASCSPVSSGSKREEEDGKEEEEEEENGIEGHDSYHGSKEPDNYCVLPRDAVLSFARDLIVNHRMEEVKRFLPNFLADKQNPRIFMFKLTMLIFDCFQDDDFRNHFNKFLLPFFTKCIAFDIDRRDLYLELISLMVRHGQFWEAKELLAEQSRRVSWSRRSIVSLDSLYKCYSSYLEYWSWDRTKHLADTKLKATIISSSVEKHLLYEKQTSLDFMALSLSHIFTFYNDIDAAVLFFSRYADNHPNNLSAQLRLFHFLQLQLFHFLQLQKIDDEGREFDGREFDERKFDEREFDEREVAHQNQSLRLKCYERISCLDPGHPVIASICSFIPETRQELVVSLSDSVKSLMSFLDYGRNKNDLNSWNVLFQHVKNLLKYNRKDFDEVKEHYFENYHDHWQYYQFSSENLEKGMEKKLEKESEKKLEKESEKKLEKELEKKLEKELERPKVLFCSMMDVCEKFIEQVVEFFECTDVGMELKEEMEEVIKLRGN